MFMKTFALFGIFLIFNVPIISLAQQTDDAIQAIHDAKFDVHEPWSLFGFMSGLDILSLTHTSTPPLPVNSLIGKSPEYVVNYTQAFKQNQLVVAGKYLALSACCLGGLLVYYYYTTPSVLRK